MRSPTSAKTLVHERKLQDNKGLEAPCREKAWVLKRKKGAQLLVSETVSLSESWTNVLVEARLREPFPLLAGEENCSEVDRYAWPSWLSTTVCQGRIFCYLSCRAIEQNFGLNERFFFAMTKLSSTLKHQRTVDSQF